MRVIGIILILTGLPITGTCADRPSTVRELFVSEENLQIIRDPEKVEVCMLRVRNGLFSKRMDKRVYTEGRSATLKYSEANIVIARLSSESTYSWDTAKGCLPTWNARAKFYRDGKYLSADFCFGCNIVMFSKDGVPFSGEDFDAVRGEMLEIFKRYFADDPTMAEINKHDELMLKVREEERVVRERVLEEKSK